MRGGAPRAGRSWGRGPHRRAPSRRSDERGPPAPSTRRAARRHRRTRPAVACAGPLAHVAELGGLTRDAARGRGRAGVPPRQPRVAELVVDDGEGVMTLRRIDVLGPQRAGLEEVLIRIDDGHHRLHPTHGPAIHPWGRRSGAGPRPPFRRSSARLRAGGRSRRPPPGRSWSSSSDFGTREAEVRHGGHGLLRGEGGHEPDRCAVRAPIGCWSSTGSAGRPAPPAVAQPLRSAELSIDSSGMFSFGNHP